jgi:hypothetical protein
MDCEVGSALSNSGAGRPFLLRNIQRPCGAHENAELYLVQTVVFSGWANGRDNPMDHYSAIWDVAAGTFIAVSLFSGMAYIIASALH